MGAVTASGAAVCSPRAGPASSGNWYAQVLAGGDFCVPEAKLREFVTQRSKEQGCAMHASRRALIHTTHLQGFTGSGEQQHDHRSAAHDTRAKDSVKKERG